MISKQFLYFVLTCAIILPSSTSYRSLYYNYRYGVSRRFRRRPELDTTFLDAARKAFLSLVADKGRKPNDKFNRAIDEVEKALATFQGHGRKYKFDGAKAEAFNKIAELSAKSGNIESFRQALGRAMYANLTATATVKKNKEGEPSTTEDALLNGAKEFLKDIKTKIGEESFEELVSVNGEVTLAFVIDSTASMREDIAAAKAIAEEIVKHKREVPVDFILSQFNDPDVGPTVFRDEGDLALAIDDLRNMTVKGGGDCPEMTFEGMLQALYHGPMPGSAMYVFTDASPKDDSVENIENVKALAIDLGIPIYFFTNGDCGNPKNVDSFRMVAQDTGGLMFPLHNSDQIKKLSNLVQQNLRSVATLSANNAKDVKRDKKYVISVDDSVDTIRITVTMVNPSDDVKLISPDNVTHGVTHDLELSVIFEVKNPIPGDWILTVPLDAGNHEYFVKTVNAINIDFSHYYFKYPPRIKDKSHIPVTHPLLGEDALVMIKISEVDKVDRRSLRLKVMYKNGTEGGDFKLHKVGNSGMRFRARLKLSEGPYKLQLKGTTKTGHPFTRMTTKFEVAKPFRLRVVYARQYTLPVGKTSALILAIENHSTEKNFTFDVTDSFGYAQLDESNLLDRRRHLSPTIFFKLKFRVPHTDKANVNKTNRVVIKAIGEHTGITSTLVTHLLVADP